MRIVQAMTRGGPRIVELWGQNLEVQNFNCGGKINNYEEFKIRMKALGVECGGN